MASLFFFSWWFCLFPILCPSSTFTSCSTRHNKLNFDGKQAAAAISCYPLQWEEIKSSLWVFSFLPIFRDFHFNYTSWHLCCVLRHFFPSFCSCSIFSTIFVDIQSLPQAVDDDGWRSDEKRRPRTGAVYQGSNSRWFAFANIFLSLCVCLLVKFPLLYFFFASLKDKRKEMKWNDEAKKGDHMVIPKAKYIHTKASIVNICFDSWVLFIAV